MAANSARVIADFEQGRYFEPAPVLAESRPCA